MIKNTNKKLFKNAFICYLALMTGCTNTTSNISPSANEKTDGSSIYNTSTSIAKNTVKEDNKYNLPTLDLAKKETAIEKESKDNIFNKSSINTNSNSNSSDSFEQKPLNNQRDKETGNQMDLESMATGLANAQASDAVKNWFAQRHATAELSLGAGESGIKTGSFDLLMPLVDSDKDLFFTQLGARRSNRLTEDYRNTVNLGLGYRHTMDKWLLGVNSFYDRDTTGGNDRVGLGVEAWTDYLKLSGNSYIRLSDWKQSGAVEDYQERPANGWDLRAEAFLPQYPQLGGKVMYEQYYGDEVGLFGSSNRQKDPSSATLGLSYTPIPLITMSTDYRQGQNGLSETSVRLGINFQLGVPLAKQLSVEQLRASRLIANTRYNLVSRNNEIVLDFKKNETGYIVLPIQLKGSANDTLSFPVNITGEVRNVTWSGTASAYARTYGGAANATIVLPPYNASGANTYTLQAIGTDKYGKVVESNVMQIGVESLKIAVERSVSTVAANGEDEVTFTATLAKETGEIVPNSDITWQVQGNASVVTQETKTDTTGKARIKLRSLFANSVSVTASEPDGAKAEAEVVFVAEESTAKVISITATPSTVHADGISMSTLVAVVQNANNQSVGAGTKVDWTTTIGTLSGASSQTDETGKATITINSTVLGSAKVTATAIKGAANTNVIFDAVPAIVNTLVLTANPESITADGVSKSIITVTIKDANNIPVNNATVTWSKSISDVTLSVNSSVTNSSGQTTVDVTSGATAGNLIITATTTNGSGNKTITLIATAIKPASITLVASPTTITADGISTSNIVATLKDSNGNAVPANTTVNWATTDGVLSLTSSVTNTSGQAINTITSVVKATTATITANSTVSKTVDVKFELANLSVVLLTPTPSTIRADGVETSTLVATVKDQNGNAVGSGIQVNFSHNAASFGMLSSPAALTDSTGKASILFTGTAPGTATITAGVNGGGSVVPANVILTAVTDYNITLVSSPSSIKSDGIDSSAITAHVTNSDGSTASNIKVTFEAQGGTLSSSTGSTNSNGNVTVTFKSTVVGSAFIIALPVGTDTSKGAGTPITVYDPTASNGTVTLSLTATKSRYDYNEDGVLNSITGTATATLKDINNIAVQGKQITIECVSGCLSVDGSQAMDTITGLTNNHGRVANGYDRGDNDAAGDLIIRATLVEDTNVTQTFNVSQNGTTPQVN